MDRMRSVLFLLTVIWVIFVRPVTADTPFFRNTPLKPVYEALLNNHPLLAYQELSTVVRQSDLDALGKQWSLAGIEVLKQTRCGRDMLSADVSVAPIKVVLAVRSNPRQQYVYQVLIEAEHSEQATSFNFKDSKGQIWFSGTLPKSDSPVACESPEWYAPLPSGSYTLTLDKEKLYQVFVSPVNSHDWLDPWSDRGIVHLKLPGHIAGCPPTMVLQDWLSEDFDLVGKPKLVKSDRDYLLPTTYPKGAAWFGLSASYFYFQGGLEIEMRQRISVPVSWLPGQREQEALLKKAGVWPSRTCGEQ